MLQQLQWGAAHMGSLAHDKIPAWLNETAVLHSQAFLLQGMVLSLCQAAGILLFETSIAHQSLSADLKNLSAGRKGQVVSKIRKANNNLYESPLC